MRRATAVSRKKVLVGWTTCGHHQQGCPGNLPGQWREGQTKEKEQNQLPTDSTSRCPLQSEKTCPTGSLTKAPWVTRKPVHNPETSPRCLAETNFHRNLRAKQPGSASNTPSGFTVSPFTARGQQCPCHLWFCVYCLVPDTTLKHTGQLEEKHAPSNSFSILLITLRWLVWYFFNTS